MMAASVKGLLGLGCQVFRNTFSKISVIQGTRFLYTDSSLGLDGYTLSRNHISRQFNTVEMTFKNKMNEICQSNTSMIFTEDLKAILHLAQNTPEDLNLIMRMIEKYNKQNDDLRFSNFIFGPVIMRTLYYLDKPTEALEMFTNPSYEKLLNQQITYQILMCLLYKHGEFEQMKSLFEMVSEKNMHATPYPRNIINILMGACWKANTAESFKYGTELWSKLAAKGIKPSRRSGTFFAHLAIQQGSPDLGLEIVSSLQQPHYIDCRCLRILACSELDRFDDIIMMIKSSIQEDRIDGKKPMYFHDVIKKLETTINEKQPKEMNEILELIDTVRVHHHIAPQTLSSHLQQPIDHRPLRNPNTQGWSTLNRSTDTKILRRNTRLMDII